MNRQLANRLLLTVIVFVAALWGWFWWYSGLRTVPAGVRLGDWSIGGLTQNELAAAWQARLGQLHDSAVRLEIAGEPGAAASFTLGELGLAADETPLSELTEYVFEGSRLSKAKHRWLMRRASLPLPLRVSDQTLRDRLLAAWPERMKPATKNAERLVTADDRIEYIPELKALTVDTVRLSEQLTALGYERLRLAGQPDSAGSDAPAADVVQVPMREVVPAVTEHQLKAQGVSRKISEFSTVFPGGAPGRVHNIQATAATIQDRLLAPGEQFDYSAVIRDTERTAGFQEAPVIYNGKLVQGVGGGICQVSTTLYNAALRAGLQIDERRSHSLPVSYVPLGQDATFASGYINFRFTNNTGFYLLIRTESDASRLTVKLFGTMPESVAYEIESNVLQTLEPSAKYVRNPSLAPGARSVIQPGKRGFVVETFRIRKENGVAVSRERISKDTYQPQPALIAIRGGGASPDGKLEPPGGVRSIIEDGVSGPVLPGR